MTASADDIGQLRLVAQGVVGGAAPTPTEAVRRLLAVQAQDLPGAVTSVALRTSSRKRADVLAALDTGELVRSWPIRGTLHLVAGEDLHWLLDYLAPRVLAGTAARRAQLGLTEDDVARARAAATAALRGGALSRTGVLTALAEDGVPTDGQRGHHLLALLSRTGTLCLGPTNGAEQLFVLLDEWVRAPRRLAAREAMAELALRYFRGHGPATLADLVRWAGCTVHDARGGLAAARPQLQTIEVDGVEHFLDPTVPDRLAACRDQVPEALLLPGFDEFVLGYRDRAAVLDPRFADRVVPGGNGMFRGTVVSGGRIVGTWRYTGSGPRRTVTAEPFTAFSDEVSAAIPAAVDALTAM